MEDADAPQVAGAVSDLLDDLLTHELVIGAEGLHTYID